MNKRAIIAALTARKIDFDPQASVAELNLLLRASWLTVRNSTDEGFDAGADYDFEMTINGQIGTDYYGDQGYSAKQFQDELKPLKGKKGLLNIHSGGGNVWDGFAIAEMVRTQGNIDTKILGIAASAADVIFQAGATRIMPQMAMRMGHCASALIMFAGNAKELTAQKAEYDKTIARLEKHDETLAKMYANRSGQTMDEVKADMEAEEFMDGDESLAKGYCDQLTEDMPVSDRVDLSHLKKVPAPVLNQFSEPPQGTAKTNHQPKTQETTVNKTHKIALLNSWGVKLPSGVTAETVTDKWLDDEIAKGKPVTKIAREQNVALLNSWGVKFEATATDEAIENLVAEGKPKTAPKEKDSTIVNLDDHPVVKAMKLQVDNQRRDTLRGKITALAGEDRIPANQIEDWTNDAFAATDTADGNPVINRLSKLEPKAPGVHAVSIELGTEEPTIARVDGLIIDLLKVTRAPGAAPSNERRQTISTNSKKISALVNRLKKFEKTPEHPHGILVGPLRDAWDAWASGVQNANAMSADLLRQIILSELMRAFRREFASLSLFAHNYKDVALQGNNKVEVPYYPLDTVASTEFIQANGYVINPNAVTSSKEILVGGIGDGVSTPGSGRKYKGLQFSAYEISRQPWLNMAQNIIMAAEQLAIDVRADIIGARIKQANFGNAIWSGAAGGFDSSVVSQYLQNAAIKAFWPLGMRNMVLTPDFYTTLAADPYVKAFMNIGSTDTIREGRIGGLYGFKDTMYDALLPVQNFIAGGSGTVTAGPDLNLAGWICYPSAVLIATAPIMPGPATMRLLAAYEQVTDDQTGLTFSYQYSGNVLGSVDNEIIECCYGSGLGELAALKRIVSAGN